ncbi:hypothetical protein A9Q97_06405 [Rhodospirillales bacterium 47_12_T64]|nr:hypothetical protein A9Q97_06405 [Rhodospirillales bacterium 47_12_T64]
MNWNKIVLIVSWIALVSLISATAGYTIYGPSVPLPYVYTPPSQTEEPPVETSDQSSDETHSSDNMASKSEEPDHGVDDASEDHDKADVTTHADTPEEVPEADHPVAEETTDHSQPSDEAHVTTEAEDNHSDPASQPEEHAAEPSNEHEAASDTGQETSLPEAEHSAPDTAHQDTSEHASSTDEHTTEHPAPEIAALTPTEPAHEDALNNVPSWKRYSQKPPEAGDRPKIALVLTGLGLSRAATEAAIRQLPSTITLSFTPYARDLESWIALARSHHHEVLLDLPMEPLSYPSDDPGPQALLTGRQPEGNINNLAWIANRGSGYVGMSVYMGDRFVTSERQMKPVMEYFKDHGLLFLDNGRNKESLAVSLGSQYGVPVAVNQRAIDEAQLSRAAIDSRLAQVERIALKNGYAIATGRPYPVTLERIATWANNLESKGYQLVPLTAVASVPETPVSQPDAHSSTSAAASHSTEEDKGESSGH